MRFELDLQPYVAEAIAKINASIDTHGRELLKRAYEAGYDRGFDEASETWGTDTELPTFEEFLRELTAELRP